MGRERRLLVELSKLDVPLLAVWCHDSDLWGYALVEGGEVVVDFSSKAAGFEPTTYFGEPADASIHAGDPSRVASVFGFSESASKLGRVQRKRAPMIDKLVFEFCSLLHVEGAATSYRYVEAGEGTEGWAAEVVRFKRPRVQNGTSLHALAQWKQPDRAPEPTPKLDVPLGLTLAARIIGLIVGVAFDVLFLPFGFVGG